MHVDMLTMPRRSQRLNPDVSATVASVVDSIPVAPVAPAPVAPAPVAPAPVAPVAPAPVAPVAPVAPAASAAPAPAPIVHIIHVMPVKTEPVVPPTPVVSKTCIIIDIYTHPDSSVKIAIKGDVCTITESYIAENNANATHVTSIPVSGFATYLYTYLCAACLDEHAGWNSVQIMPSFIPSIYIKRENLAAKREHIVQTLVSHVMNMK